MYRFLREKKAQSTAEFAILIAVVVTALIVMQHYVQRGLQGRMRDTVDYTGSDLGTTILTGEQFIPDYVQGGTMNRLSESSGSGEALASGVRKSNIWETSNREGTQTIGGN